MRRLRTISSRRLAAIVAIVAALVAGAGIAQAALGGDGPKPDPKPLDQAIHDALNAKPVAGITARIEFTNGLLPSGSLPAGQGSPLAAGAKGRLWMTGDGRLRLELQSEAGDAQVVIGKDRFSVYDASSNTAYVGAIPEGGEKKQAHEPPSLAQIQDSLSRVAQSWNLSGAEPTSVAGRPAYTVRIAPKDDGGLLGASEVAWDAVKGVPLRAAVYAQGKEDPVLELKATDISYGTVPASRVAADPPKGATVVDVDPEGHDAQGRPAKARGVHAVTERLGFPLAAPKTLAGLPRKQVRLADFGGEPAALVSYGEGLGGIVVLERKADPAGGSGKGGFALPEINIDGATGTELATALGTLVTFERGGVSYSVVGSVPPQAAENAARGLR
jgi:outer membrane lipoprotein-sorting protein